MREIALAALIVLCGCSTPPPEDSAGPAWPKNPTPKTYLVTYLPHTRILVDGVRKEHEWNAASRSAGFVFPWRGRGTKPPRTEFRALCDDAFLYFFFTVEDEDVVVDQTTRGETALIAEDRVELYFAADLRLKEYYCVEMDFRGRRLDYKASYHRNFDFSWSFPGMTTAGTRTETGYTVEGTIALSSLESLGLPDLDSGELLVGIYRAEFSHGEGPEPLENWISWIDPNTTEEDFHIPGTLGVFKKS